jgi:hypothetical protein
VHTLCRNCRALPVSDQTRITHAFQAAGASPPHPTESTQANYGYDKLYRLTNVIPNPVTQATPTEQYAYDLVQNPLAEQKSNHPSGLITRGSVGGAFTYNANHQLAAIAQLVERINANTQTDPNAIPVSAIRSILENRAYSADGRTKDVNPSGANNEL